MSKHHSSHACLHTDTFNSLPFTPFLSIELSNLMGKVLDLMGDEGRDNSHTWRGENFRPAPHPESNMRVRIDRT